jgi:hypothetical protein
MRSLQTPKDLISKASFSSRELLVFGLVFFGIGAYVLYRSFAAGPLVASMEAEQMSLPAGASVITDASASGGKALQLLSNGTSSGSVSLPSNVTDLTIMARGAQCQGAPTMSVSVDGNTVLTSAVSATTWSSYSATKALATGSHTVSISFSGDYQKTKGRKACDRNLYIDVTNLFGPIPAPTPAPTVALSASPTSLTAGQSATLTWNSTNATSCTASGAWSGTQPTSGSTSTGALNTNSTYSLTCTGPGGSGSASVTIAVASGSILPPAPPSTYTVPTGAEIVSTSAQFIAALGKAQHDIVLADGIYDNSGTFSNSNSNRIYAQHLGGATLKAGIINGGNFGPGNSLLQGLVFDLIDPAKTFQGGEVNIWGPSGQNTRIYDCVFKGNKVIGSGIFSLNNNGLDLQRDQFFNFTDEGIRAGDNVPVSYGGTTAHIKTMWDIYVDGVTTSPPGATDGKAEAGIWVGHPVDNGVKRVKIRNVSTSGIETVNNSWDTTFSDIDIDMTCACTYFGVGVYLEHYNYHNIFDSFSIVARTGFNGEWDYGTTGNSGAHYTTIKNGTLTALTDPVHHTVGVYLDEGTEATTITGVTFKNQNWAAVGAYLNNKSGTVNTISGNTYQLLPGAIEFTTNHM